MQQHLNLRRHMLNRYTLTSALALVLASSAVSADELNVYSARKEALIGPLIDKFSESTGITVNLLTGKADALLKRLQSEGVNTPADILLTVDAGRLHRAKQAGLLKSVESKVLDSSVPAHLRDADKQWTGLSLRSRPIFYVKGKVKPEQLSTYEDLADPKWKGKICVRSSNNIYNQSLVASMIASEGKEKTQQWLNGFTKNFAQPPRGGDRDQIKAAAAGICDVAIANTYYLGKMLNGKDEKQKAAANKVAIFWPNQDGRGAHVNVSGAGIIKHSENSENAVKLLEFLVSPESQAWYAETNNEYPVVAGVSSSKTLQGWGEFKADQLNLTELGKLNKSAVMMMDAAGWK